MALTIDCTTKDGIGLPELLMALIGCDSTTELPYIRVYQPTCDDYTPITCQTHDQLAELIRRSIHVDADGRPSLRVVSSAKTDGGCGCAMNQDFEQSIRMCFCEDNATGDCALVFGYIDSSPQ